MKRKAVCKANKPGIRIFLPTDIWLNFLTTEYLTIFGGVESVVLMVYVYPVDIGV